jgi:ABC-type bacteriocin/lantibiotic exporter with double-glycine peptidase domain
MVRAMQPMMTSTQLYLRLLRYVRPYAFIFGVSILGMLISAATEVALPAAVKPFLDGTFVDNDPLLIKWTPIALVFLFIFRGVGSFMGQYASAWVGNKVVMDLRDQMFRATRCSVACWRCHSAIFTTIQQAISSRGLLLTSHRSPRLRRR